MTLRIITKRRERRMTTRTTKTGTTAPPAWRTSNRLMVVAAAAVMATAGWCGGCASPPSVTPLLAVVEQTLRAEADDLQTDAARLDEQYAGQRQSLRAGFEADLAGRTPLEPAWVAEHVRVYVAACEALAEAHIKQRHALAQRRANLRDAATAQQRAAALLERQDKLFEQVPDLRRWLNASTTSPSLTPLSPSSTESER